MKELCYWSIADGEYSYMLQALVNSYRAVGMKDDFHVFCDRNIEGAITHPIESFDKSFFWFKFTFLQRFVQQLDYRHYAYIDSDNYFVRKPRPFLDLLEKSPVHSFLEFDCTLPALRKVWHACPLPEYVRLMRECGITTKQVYNVNAGFFIVKRDAVDVVCSFAEEFWEHALKQGYVFTEEAPLAYATQMLCEDPEKHLLRDLSDIWCSEWTGHFAGRIPDGKGWMFDNYMTYEPYMMVDPAIVHAIKSKEALIALGKKSLTENEKKDVSS